MFFMASPLSLENFHRCLETGPARELVGCRCATNVSLAVGRSSWKGIGIGLGHPYSSKSGIWTWIRQLFWWSSTFWENVVETHKSLGFQFVVLISMTNGRIGIYIILYIIFIRFIHIVYVGMNLSNMQLSLYVYIHKYVFIYIDTFYIICSQADIVLRTAHTHII